MLDQDGWVLAVTGRVTPGSADDGGAGLLGGLFRWLLERDDPPYPPERPRGPRRRRRRCGKRSLGRDATAWYGSGPEREAIVAAAVPIAGAAGVEGAVVLEQASEPILTLTNRALVRLMTFTLLATRRRRPRACSATRRGCRCACAGSQAPRATRSGRAARSAAECPGQRRGDELGALARSFAELLERLREHTDYLRTLASKLSHELRTPLAVVTTSLDNLEHEVKAPAAEHISAACGRARSGSTRSSRR